MFVIGAHQPVLNFHTGLIAKIWAMNTFPGYQSVWVVHDLDTLEEDGAINIKVPTKNGVLSLPLYSRVDRNKLFTTTAQYVGVKKVADVLVSWLEPSSRTVKQIRERADELDSRFTPGEVVIGIWNTELLLYTLEFLGVPKPQQIFYLSHLLSSPEVKVKTKLLVDRFGPQGFWEWEGDTRKPLSSSTNLLELVEEERLIPKAIPLSALFRLIVGREGVVIRGMGQAEYEKNCSDLPPVRKAPVVTSFQAFQLREVGVRPSALVMYLLGVKFDPHCVVWK
jgi:hypothetical protein